MGRVNLSHLIIILTRITCQNSYKKVIYSILGVLNLDLNGRGFASYVDEFCFCHWSFIVLTSTIIHNPLLLVWNLICFSSIEWWRYTHMTGKISSLYGNLSLFSSLYRVLWDTAGKKNNIVLKTFMVVYFGPLMKIHWGVTIFVFSSACPV